MRFLSLIAVALGLVGCAAASKNYDYMSRKDYQDRPKLTHGLVGPADTLTESAVQKILNSKVTLPKTLNIAVVRLSDSADGMDFQTIDEEIAAQFYGKANWGARVQSVIPMPQLMLSRPVTLASLRQAAVLLQADALVIVKPVSYGDWKFQWTDKNKAKGVTSLEVLLLDTRTSVVPYTSLVTETAEVLKDREDYSEYEMISRAKKASEAKALLQVAPAIQKFISKAM